MISNAGNDTINTAIAMTVEWAASIGVLVEHGYLAPVITNPITGPGRRPSPSWHVHPNAAADPAPTPPAVSVVPTPSPTLDSADSADIAETTAPCGHPSKSINTANGKCPLCIRGIAP